MSKTVVLSVGIALVIGSAGVWVGVVAARQQLAEKPLAPLGPPSPAATRPDPQQVVAKDAGHDVPEKIARAAMDQLKTGDLSAMFDVLNRKTILTPTDRREIEVKLKLAREAWIARLGKPIGEYEFVVKEVLGESFVRFVFLEKLERSAFVWRLTFYRVAGEWYWHSFGLDDNLDVRFKPTLH